MKRALIIVLTLLLMGCSASRQFNQTLSKWTSYQEPIEWVKTNFVYDHLRFNAIVSGRSNPFPMPPETLFSQKHGVCLDVAFFFTYCFMQINADYKPKVVYLDTGKIGDNHYVCSFHLDDKLYIADYGIPEPKRGKTTGPYNNLEEYKTYLNTKHPYWRALGVRSVSYMKW